MTKNALDTLEESMSQSVGEYMQTLARQGKSEGRLVMHDDKGNPIAAMVLFRSDVAQRLQHLDKFVETSKNYFSTSLQ